MSDEESSSEVTDVDEDQHPLATLRFTCPSEPMNRLCSEVRAAIKFNIPSLVFAGERRMGKTTALEYIEDHVVEALGKAYGIFRHRCRTPESRLTEPNFHSQLLTSLRHTHAASTASAERKFDRLIYGLVERTLNSPNRRLIVLLDEAHRLTYREYEWLITIHNELSDGYKIRLTYILVGQPDLATRRIEYLSEGQRQITGRFMAQDLWFSGLMSAKEIEHCSKQIDSTLVWPKNGRTYSEFFAPNAFQDGWRYSSHSELLWDAFADHSKGMTTREGVSMTSYIAVTAFLLRKIAASSPSFKGFTATDIDEALQHMAYLEAQVDDDDD